MANFTRYKTSTIRNSLTLKKLLVVLSLLSIFCLLSCKNKIDIEGFNEEAWMHDKNGCEGIRNNMKNQLIGIKEQLKALTTDEIISVLGRPDKTRLGERNQRYFIYSISPAEPCENYSAAIVNTLSIRFNAVGRAYEVLII